MHVEPADRLEIQIESTVKKQFEHLIRARIEAVLRAARGDARDRPGERPRRPRLRHRGAGGDGPPAGRGGVSVDKLHSVKCRQGRRFMIRVLPGTKLVDELLQFARMVDLHHGAIVSAVGSVRERGVQRHPGRRPPADHRAADAGAPRRGAARPARPRGQPRARRDGPAWTPHLHIFAAKSSGEAIGGHLLEAEVFATCEIILGEYIVEGVERQHSTRGGVDTLFFEDK